jgi:hypothetical protein
MGGGREGGRGGRRPDVAEPFPKQLLNVGDEVFPRRCTRVVHVPSMRVFFVAVEEIVLFLTFLLLLLLLHLFLRFLLITS